MPLELHNGYIHFLIFHLLAALQDIIFYKKKSDQFLCNQLFKDSSTHTLVPPFSFVFCMFIYLGLLVGLFQLLLVFVLFCIVFIFSFMINGLFPYTVFLILVSVRFSSQSFITIYCPLHFPSRSVFQQKRRGY